MLDPALLLATKFHIPPSRTDLVTRPRLINLLDEGVHQPLTLISAPPGFGKSMLVANWLLHSKHGKTNPLSAGWLSLDDSDNQPIMFWRYFIAALQHARSGLGETAQSMLSSSQPPPLETILVALINDLAGLSAPCVLVLDDYQMIQSEEIHAGLNYLLDHQPQDFHLMLLTREDPPLALARRRARRQLLEVRAADLRFSLEETAAFLNSSMGLTLTTEQVASLERHTEGWVVGLQMAALSLQGRDPDAFFRSFAGDNRYIADYLIEEVLQHQSEAVRTFLLKTSILERMCAPLCAALFDDPHTESPEDELSNLERSNLFIIPLDNRREWYRYHHLFAELLQQRLRQVYTVDEISNLHRRASLWYENQPDIPSAIQHARLIPDHESVVGLLERHSGFFFFQSELPRFRRWVNELPVSLCQAHPCLCMAAAWAAVATNYPEEARAWLVSIERRFGYSAESALSDPNLTPELRAALLEVLVLQLQSPLNNLKGARLRQRTEQIQAALETLPPDQLCLFNTIMTLKPVITFDMGTAAEMCDDLEAASLAFNVAVNLSREVKNTHIFHLSLGHLANIQVQQGRLRFAAQTHGTALAQAESLGKAVSPYIALAHAGLGAIAYEHNELDSAALHFNAALPLGRSWNQWEILLPTILGMARLKHAAGEDETALSILDEVKAPTTPDYLLPIAAYRARLLVETGRHAEADSWYRNCGLSSVTEPNAQNEYVLLEIARLLISFNKADQAIRLTEKIMRSAAPGGRIWATIQAQVLLAKLFALQERFDEAQKILSEALRCAAPEGFLRTFVDEGEVIHRLLKENRTKDVKDCIGQILNAFGQDQKTRMTKESAAGLPDPLSEREREVLRLVADGLSNQDIANHLVISITTVKTHVGNIFLKMGVTSRTQAVARAEAMGLLLPPH